MSAAHKGKKRAFILKLSKEQCISISEYMKQKWSDPKYRQKMSDAHKNPSEEIRKKMSLAKKGKKKGPYSAEHRAAISRAKKGKPLSAKNRVSLCVAQKARQAREHAIKEYQ
jgi:hypothetical protein